MTCVNANEDSIHHPYYSTESRIATGVMALVAIVGTVEIFWFKSRVDRPGSVTYLWVIIDLAILCYVISQICEPFSKNENSLMYFLGY